jgi:hypothetical protein
MPKFCVQNLTDKDVSIGIEPWADVEILKPRGKMEIDYDEPAELGFALLRDEKGTIDIVSGRVIVSANGKDRKIYPFG